jgi:hypothetical protein
MKAPGPWSYLMLVVNVFHASAVIRSIGPAPWSLVSRMAMRPVVLATSTHCPPCPPLYDDLRQFSLVKFSPDCSHEFYRIPGRQRGSPEHPHHCNKIAYLLEDLDNPCSAETLRVDDRGLP